MGVNIMSYFVVGVIWIIKTVLSMVGDLLPQSEHKVRSLPLPQNRVDLGTVHRPTRPWKFETRTEQSRVVLPLDYKSTRSGEFETQVEEIMYETQQFLCLGDVSDEDKEDLTTHQRAYYAHYYTAKFQLSQNNINAFKHELKRAGNELSEMEAILTTHRIGLKTQVPGQSVKPGLPQVFS